MWAFATIGADSAKPKTRFTGTISSKGSLDLHILSTRPAYQIGILDGTVSGGPGLLAGWTPEEDTLPARFLSTPLPNDPAASLSRERLDGLVAEYHRQRGW
jgi:hypothetical protein